MNERSGVERRKSERYDAHLNLKVHIGTEDLVEQIDGIDTINVSASGLYFESKKWIEPMTKLALSFDVPVDAEDRSKLEEVACEGIVVRVVPEEEDPAIPSYEIAVFFTTIDAESLHHLESYLSVRLSA
jgi:hypothetical protein